MPGQLRSSSEHGPESRTRVIDNEYGPGEPRARAAARSGRPAASTPPRPLPGLAEARRPRPAQPPGISSPAPSPCQWPMRCTSARVRCSRRSSGLRGDAAAPGLTLSAIHTGDPHLDGRTAKPGKQASCRIPAGIILRMPFRERLPIQAPAASMFMPFHWPHLCNLRPARTPGHMSRPAAMPWRRACSQGRRVVTHGLSPGGFGDGAWCCSHETRAQVPLSVVVICAGQRWQGVCDRR